MIATRLAALFAPLVWLFGLIFGLCWLFYICEPLLFVWNIYLWLSRVMLNN